MDNRIEILPDVFLTSVQTDKFKTGCFSVNLLRPMRREEASANALIPSVLLRGSERWPDIRAISARLDELYGASVGTLVRKKGEMQMTGFFADYIEDALAGEPVVLRGAGLREPYAAAPEAGKRLLPRGRGQERKAQPCQRHRGRASTTSAAMRSHSCWGRCVPARPTALRGLASWRTWSARTSGAFLRITMKFWRIRAWRSSTWAEKRLRTRRRPVREALKELPRGVCTAVGTSVRGAGGDSAREGRDDGRCAGKACHRTSYRLHGGGRGLSGGC